MRYLTKEWYQLSQQTCLHFGLEVKAEAAQYSEALYQVLYKIKEQEFIQQELESYECDPRALLNEDGAAFVPVSKFISGEELKEEDSFIFHMPQKQKDRIQEMIKEYDSRPTFDETKIQKTFMERQEETISNRRNELEEYGLLDRIADIRVFALGYCTEDVLEKLTQISQENEEEVRRISEECSRAVRKQNLPKELIEKYGFHDCSIIRKTVNENVVLQFDTEGGFSQYDTVTYIDAEVVKMEEPIVGSIWVYDELYRIDNGYEAHILLWGEGMPEIIIRCKDIVVTGGEEDEERHIRRETDL